VNSVIGRMSLDAGSIQSWKLRVARSANGRTEVYCVFLLVKKDTLRREMLLSLWTYSSWQESSLMIEEGLRSKSKGNVKEFQR
jgi:hypothetical protein